MIIVYRESNNSFSRLGVLELKGFLRLLESTGFAFAINRRLLAVA